MKVNSPHARDVKYHLHPFTNLAQHQESGPDIFKRGQGIYVFDDDGKRYIEGLAELWCALLGFREQRLIKAAMQPKARSHHHDQSDFGGLSAPRPSDD